MRAHTPTHATARSLRSARLAAGLAVLGSLLALAGCGPDYDPLTREGLYNPVHSNRENLHLMVANPSDLVRGDAASSSDGQLGAAAVDRLRNDKVKALPASDISTIAAGSSGTNTGAAP